MHKFSLLYSDTDIAAKACAYLLSIWKTQDSNVLRSLVFLCIGSDRYTGDALGPLVGTFLRESTNCIVYGSLEQPVHAGNLATIVSTIQGNHQKPLIVAIDACLGKKSEIGKIEIWPGSIEAGIAVGNKLPKVGDIGIVGIVNSGSSSGYLELQSTSLALVMRQAKTLAIIIDSFQKSVKKQLTASITPEIGHPSLDIK